MTQIYMALVLLTAITVGTVCWGHIRPEQTLAKCFLVGGSIGTATYIAIIITIMVGTGVKSLVLS